MDRKTIAYRRQKVIELHEQGLAGGAIGRELGITRQRVHQLRVLLGLTVTDTVAERRAEVAELIKAGKSPRHIRQVFECSNDVLYRDAEALGLVEALRANRNSGPTGAHPAE